MNFYLVTTQEGDTGSWHPTLSEAHKHAKLAPNRIDVLIDLFDVQTDKEGVLAMLRGFPVRQYASKTWRLSTRGGLIECNPSQR